MEKLKKLNLGNAKSLRKVILYETIFSFNCLKFIKIKPIIITLLGYDKKLLGLYVIPALRQYNKIKSSY